MCCCSGSMCKMPPFPLRSAILFVAILVALCGDFAHGARAADCGMVPAQAAAVGYTKCTYGPRIVMGQNWFKLDPHATITTNADGSVTFHGQGGSFHGNHNNQQIGTAVPGTNGNFTGTAFGGGAYYEIVASFPTPLHLGGAPDWWLGEIEFWSGNPVTQWQGQPAGFNHWMEQDMPGFLTTDHALIGMRDRWGMASGGLTTSGYSEVDGPARGLTAPGWPLPPGFDPSRLHKYGYLWVPATTAAKGYMKQFLDDVQLGPTVFWNQYDPNEPPPPVDGSSAYSVQDVRHYFGSFGSNPENPTTLYSFKAWQLSAANDLGPTNP